MIALVCFEEQIRPVRASVIAIWESRPTADQVDEATLGIGKVIGRDNFIAEIMAAGRSATIDINRCVELYALIELPQNGRIDWDAMRAQKLR